MATKTKATPKKKVKEEAILAPVIYGRDEIFEHFNKVPDRVQIAKRSPIKPDLTTLKEQQLEAFNILMEFINTPSAGMAVLEGVAGTGKTYTMSVLIEHLLVLKPNQKILVTAPTNRAVKVAMDSAEYKHMMLDYATIHSALRLKDSINDDGQLVFIEDKGQMDRPIDNAKIVFVDEASMLDDDLFGKLRNLLLSKDLKIIFVGDPLQIPPVNHPDSLPFNALAQKQYGILKATLTQIVRQAIGNPIIEASQSLREEVTSPTALSNYVDAYADKGSITFINSNGREEDHKYFHKAIDTMYLNGEFVKESTYAKVICWTNKNVDDVNKFIRRKLWGDGAKASIVVGEELVADAPITEKNDYLPSGKSTVYRTNQEFKVISTELGTENINDGQFLLQYYKCMTETWEDNVKVKKSIRILHEDSAKTYNDILTLLKDLAIGYKRGSQEARAAWKDYYEFLEVFARVKYGYAITAHKSQGGQYDYVLVMMQDVKKNRDVYERNRILYTAMTRTKHRLFLVY